MVQWLRQRHPQAPLWLAGFSFGAYVAVRSVAQAGAERLLLVAPPVGMFYFKDIAPIDIPWMVIQGGQDEIIQAQAVSTWVHQQRRRPDYRWMADADHFFHGRLNRIREAVMATWQTAVAGDSGAGRVASS